MKISGTCQKKNCKKLNGIKGLLIMKEFKVHCFCTENRNQVVGKVYLQYKMVRLRTPWDCDRSQLAFNLNK